MRFSIPGEIKKITLLSYLPLGRSPQICTMRDSVTFTKSISFPFRKDKIVNIYMKYIYHTSKKQLWSSSQTFCLYVKGSCFRAMSHYHAPLLIL